jgi:hypothetical protein
VNIGTVSRPVAAIAGLLAIGLTVAAAFGCVHPDESPGRPAAAADPEVGGVVEGLFVWGHEVRSFRPCGSQDELWVVGAPEITQPLIAEFRKLTERPYQPVYVRLVGEISNKQEDGFGADYDGTLRVREVLEVRPATGTDCRVDDAAAVMDQP